MTRPSADIVPLHPARGPDAEAAALDAAFAALADPTRRRILAMLLEDDMAVTDVADPFEMSLAAISKHLGVLTRAGLVSQEKRGRITWCRLEPEALRAASVWMRSFGQFDPVDLDALEELLLTGGLLDDRHRPSAADPAGGKSADGAAPGDPGKDRCDGG